MLMPSLFTNSFMDDFFDAPSFGVYKYDAPAQNLMSTDVFEKEDGYEIDMNLPGFKKEDVTGEVKDGYLIIKASTKNSKDENDGYLTISAEKGLDKEEKNKEGKYIRKERYEGSCNRSFYVGDAITQDDIKAKFEDGVLKISVPKKEAKPQVEEKKFIAIEG